MPPHSYEADHAGESHGGFTGTDAKETHGEKKVPVCHQGQKGEYNEAFQGQEDGKGMGFPGEGQQEKAGPDEPTFNEHSCKEKQETKPKLREKGIPQVAERRDSQKIYKVKGGKTLRDPDVRCFDGSGPPQGQYSEGQHKKPKQGLRGRVEGVPFYAVNVEEG